MTQTHSFKAEFYTRIQLTKLSVPFPKSLNNRLQFCPLVCWEAPSLSCSLWMKKPLPVQLVFFLSTSWFLQLGHPMLDYHPTHRPSVTHTHINHKCAEQTLCTRYTFILYASSLHTNVSEGNRVYEPNVIWHFSFLFLNNSNRTSFCSFPPPSQASPPVPCLHTAGQAKKHMVLVSTVHKAGL